MPLTPGQRLAAYEIVSSLGAGGMGEVYRARDTRLSRDVALKVLPADVTAQPDRLERFDREARVIAALNHPHIVTIYSTEESEGIRFLTMELVEGCTLSDLVMSTGMAIPKFLDIAIPFADALAAAHQKQITHRDLKPGNVMVSHDGRVKVLDFGLARVGGGAAGDETLIATRAPITHQGMIVGTMPYMSPEQVEGRPLDPRSDLFSLGVIFYELLSGERPFKGSSSPALMSAILRDPPPHIAERRLDIPEPLARLIDRLLEKRPEDRVQTARDVFNELRHIKQSPSGTSSTLRRTSDRAQQSVRVLPFAARGSDATVAALAEGLPEEIGNGLSRFEHVRVVSGDKQSANAHYAIDGQIRQAGTSVRISVKLLKTSSGDTLWSQNFDRQLQGDFFSLQDEIANRVVTTIGDPTGILARTMLASMANLPIEQLSIAELVIRFHAYNERQSAEEHAQLRDAFERALEREPSAAEGWACLAQLYRHEYSQDHNPLPDPLGRQRRAAARAVELDANSQFAWVALASAHLFARDGAGVRLAVDRAVELNPLNAVALGVCAQYMSASGDHDRAIALAERAVALKPQHPGWLHMPGFAYHYLKQNYEEALREAKAINLPKFTVGAIAEAAAAGMLGKVDEARTALRKIEEHAPRCLDPDRAHEALGKWIWDEDYLNSVIDGYRRALTLAGASLSPRPPSSGSGSLRATSSTTTVAVLPFVARSSDDESKALADALTDDLTAGLSKFGYLRMLSRSAVERLARETDLKANARYAIEGGVRRSGPTIRTTVTLVDTNGGMNLWSQTYDRDAAAGVFAIQDTIAKSATATIGDQTGALVRAMGASIAGRPADELSATELAIRYHLYTESFHPDEHERLRDALERQLEREPRVAEGWACLALLYQHEHAFGFNPRPDPLGRQRQAAERAVAIDPTSQQAWIAMAGMHCFDRDRPALHAAVDRAVRLNPLNADLIALAAIFLSVAGDDDTAVALVRQAIELKPNYPGWYHFPTFNERFARGDYAAALTEIKRVNMPRMPLMHLDAASVAGHLGQKADAVTALAALRLVDPALTTPDLARAVWAVWFWNDSMLDALVAGFVKATALERGGSATLTGTRSSTVHQRSADQSIAVLPFTDLSEKKDQDWFCDGIAEEIMNALAALPGLRVAARASAFSFRGKADDLEAIADKLNVATVLEGGVRRSGDRVRITTQLSDVQQGKVLWSERFDRELKDIFDVQEEIARAIANRLRITIAAGDERIVPMATTNIEAYQLLLKGRELVTRRGRTVLEAIPLFERAIALDPNLSDAHALLGDAYRLLGLYGVARASEVMPKARACIDRALSINPANAEALATLAIIASVYEWNLDEVRSRSDRALAADPSHVRANAERGISVSVLGRPGGDWHDEARRHLQKARDLDPLNPWVVAIQAGCMMFTGDLETAIELARHAIQLDSSNFTAHWLRVSTLAEIGRLDDSLAASEPALALSGRHTMILTNMTAIYAERGQLDRVAEIRSELSERAQTSFIGNGALACVAAAAGEWAEAREYLSRAIAERDPWVAFWKMYAWRPVWKDEQCAAMYRATPLFDFLRH